MTASKRKAENIERLVLGVSRPTRGEIMSELGSLV